MAKFLRIIFECAFLCWLKKETTHQAIVPQCYFRLDFVVLPLRPPLKATSWWLLDLEESDIFFVPYASIPGASEKTNQRLEAGKSSQIEKDNHLNQSCILFGCFHVNLPGGGKLCVFWKILATNKKTPPKFQKHRSFLWRNTNLQNFLDNLEVVCFHQTLQSEGHHIPSTWTLLRSNPLAPYLLGVLEREVPRGGTFRNRNWIFDQL